LQLLHHMQLPVMRMGVKRQWQTRN
jgi:hypothetical protein